jgi:geranylgeranylglycerol-phosphate geranylgeranyltransferase
MFSPWVKLARLPNAAVAAGGVWLGHACLPGPMDWGAAALGSLAMALLAAAGNMHNDVVDLPIDRINRPDRPLPSGSISPNAAKAGAALCLAAALALAFALGPPAGVMAAAMGALLYVYNVNLKGMPLVGNLAVALLCSLAIYLPELPHRPDYTLMPILFAFLTTVAREIAKDAEDVAGDREHGALTLPVLYGTKAARIAVAIACYATVALLPVPWLRLGYHIGYPIAAASLCLPLLALVLAGLRAPAPAWGPMQKRLKLLMVAGMIAIVLGVRG